MITDIDFHLQRARLERDMAYRSGDANASDAHMRLSALHLERAMLLQDVQRAAVGNVIPFSNRGSQGLANSNAPVPLTELASVESAYPS